MDEKLVNDELDYKELNDKFLHRPAAVMIKKPLLQADEMEDILTRLLRNYVPPAYVDSYKVPPLSGGLTTRAFLFMYHGNDYTATAGNSTTNVGSTLPREGEVWSSGSFKGESATSTSQNNYTSIDEIESMIIGWNQALIISNTQPQLLQQIRASGDAVGKTGTTNMDALLNGTGTANLKKKSTLRFYQPVSSVNRGDEFLGLIHPEKLDKNEHFVEIPNRTKLPNGAKCELLLLSTSDHEALDPDPNTGYSRNIVLKKHFYLFKDTVLPKYVGQTILYKPGTKLTEHTKKILRKAFGGKLPYNTVIAYRWQFTLDNETNDTFVYLTTIKKARQLYEKAKKTPMAYTAFFSSALNLADHIRTAPGCQITKIKDEKLQPSQLLYAAIQDSMENFDKAEATSDIYGTYYNRNVNDKTANQVKSRLRTINSAIDYLDGKLREQYIRQEASSSWIINHLPVYDEFGVKDTNVEKFKDGTFARLNVATTDLLSELEEFQKTASEVDAVTQEKIRNEINTNKADSAGYASDLRITRLRNLINDFLITLNDDVATPNYFEARNYYGVIPFLPISNTFEARRAAERAKVFQQDKAVNRVTSINPVQMTNAEFKIRYFSVLLERVKLKYEKFKPFIEDGIMQFPLYSTYLELRQPLDQWAKYAMDTTDVKTKGDALVAQMTADPDYCREWLHRCDILFFSNASGFYVTSNTNTHGSVKAPIWNSKVTEENLSELDSLTHHYLMQSSNNDVISINLSRVAKRISTGRIMLKNDKNKYAYAHTDPLQRTELCIEPMDYVMVYLPTFESQLLPVYTGIITSVNAIDDSGYHQIQINTECMLKRLKVVRTNMKPSFNREEAGNNPLTAFSVPVIMFSNIGHWMTYMFAQGLSFLKCMPNNYELTNLSVPLFTLEKKDEYDTVTVQEVVAIDYNYDSGDTTIKTTDVAKQVHTRNTRKDLYVGSFNMVKFTDPLFNYLWYTSCSKYQQEEKNFIDTNLLDLVKDYISTETYEGTKRTNTPGITPVTELLKQGKRCAYMVYKQRYTGVSGLDESGLIGAGDKLGEDREIVATIIGTSQPVFTVSPMDQTIHFSTWKTNLQIINETADKFNFCYYTDNKGVVRFTPYNFDLSILNTENYRTPVNVPKMLSTRKTRTLEYDDNPFVLKKQYISNYSKRVDDSVLVNWLRLTGAWIVGQTNFIQEVVTDPVSIAKYGIRSGTARQVAGISNNAALRLYGLSWMDRQNKKYRSAEISGLYDSRMDINCPYYVANDEIIYLAESLNIAYIAGDTCTYSMGCSYGKQPLISLKQYITNEGGNVTIKEGTFSNITTAIDDLFIKKNRISPYVYAQYKHMFDPTIRQAELNELKAKQTEAKNAYDEAVLYANHVTESLSYQMEDWSRSALQASQAADSVPLVTATNLTPTIGRVHGPTGNVTTVEQAKALYDYATADVQRYEDSLMTNCSLVCYNGYLWDNVSGISFEELGYDYGWLLKGYGLSGLNIAGDSVSAPVLATLKDVFNNLFNSEYNLTDQAKNAINTYFSNMVGIVDPENPSLFLKKTYTFTDLVTPVVGANTVQISKV